MWIDIDCCVYSNLQLASALAQYPDIHQVLLSASSCAVCEQPVVSSWLECVHFQSAKKVCMLIHACTPHYNVDKVI